MNKTVKTGLAFTGASLGIGLAARELLKRVSMLDLRGQVVLITGSSRGLGLAIAREFAHQGAHLVICARQQKPLEAARQELESLGVEVLAQICDVTKREQVQALIEQAQAHFGHIDIVVNNAGIINVGPQKTMTLADFEEALNSMYWGMVYTTLAVLPQMRERKSGHIVNITSVGGKVSVPHLLPYSSAKFAAIGFSEGLHAEVRKDGIKVVTVVPGLMRTGSHINAYVKGQQETEYSLFGLLATLPLSSMQAARAAHQIVQATRRGETEIILTVQAQILARFHGLFPGLTTDILSLMDSLLPDASANDTSRSSGRVIRNRFSSILTSLGEKAAHENNEYLNDPTDNEER